MKAKQLLDTHQTERILCMDTPPVSGYPGYDAWTERLIKQGVDPQYIAGVPMPQVPVLHTLAEAEAVVTYARQQRFRSLYVTAAPFHQPRAYMTAVTAALRIYPELNLYSQTGTPLSWLEEAVHSQGKTKGARMQLITGELHRIEKYQKQGDLASVEQVLAYLDRRDG
jgi:hypothetical protein